MRAFEIFLLVLCISPILGSNVTDGGIQGLPGVKLHLTERGMRYLSNCAGQALNMFVNENKHIPDLSRGFKEWWGKGSLKADHIQISDYNSPEFKYENRPPDRFVWKSLGGYAKVRGDWSCSYDHWFVSIGENGDFVAETEEEPRFEVSARFVKTPQGKLRAADIECSAQFSRLSLDIRRGNLPGYIMNFFGDIIANFIRPVLEAELCKHAKIYVNSIMNNHIGRMTYNKEFWPMLVADFRLTRNLLMTHDSVESWHTGWIVYKDRQNDPIPFFPHSLRRSGDEAKMIYFMVSDYFFNSILYQAHKYNMSYFETNENTSKVAHYLRPSCHVLCLGTIFPQLELLFGRNAKGHLTAYTTQTPTVILKPGMATAKGEGYVQVYAMEGTNKTKMFGVLGSVEIDVQFEMANPEGEDPRLVYNMSIKSVRLERLDSDIDAIQNGSEAIIEQFITFSTGFIEEVVNEAVESGDEIIFAPGVRLKNSQISILDRTVEIATDFVFYDRDTVFDYEIW